MSQMLHLSIESMCLGQPIFLSQIPWATFVLQINHGEGTKHLPASAHLGSHLPENSEQKIFLHLLTVSARMEFLR